MDDSASQALMMAFAVIVFVLALSLAMYLISRITETAEILTFHTDETNYYDNVAVVGTEGIERYVSTETVIPTLYRYYKENFCVKIYDATGIKDTGSSETNPVLVQILDVNLEGRVENAAKKTKWNPSDSNTAEYYDVNSLNLLFNDNRSSPFNYVYMFGAPWLDSTDNMKLRIDLLVNGEAGYINNQLVDYTDHPFAEMIKRSEMKYTGSEKKYQFKENFVSYSYTGDTMTTEDGDVLVTGASSKDKIVITYTLVELDEENSKKINESRKPD